MPRSFGLVDNKVKKAEYFLLRIKEADNNMFDFPLCQDSS